MSPGIALWLLAAAVVAGFVFGSWDRTAARRALRRDYAHLSRDYAALQRQNRALRNQRAAYKAAVDAMAAELSAANPDFAPDFALWEHESGWTK